MTIIFIEQLKILILYSKDRSNQTFEFRAHHVRGYATVCFMLYFFCAFHRRRDREKFPILQNWENKLLLSIST